MKKIAATILIGGLFLVGAGCTNTTPVTPAPNNNNTTPPTGTEEQADSLTLSAETTGNSGEVKLQWSVPVDMDPTNKLQLTHGSTPEKTVADGAYWQNLGPSSREYLWTGVKSGKRYFKICELKDNTCVKTSNIVEVEVR